MTIQAPITAAKTMSADKAFAGIRSYTIHDSSKHIFTVSSTRGANPVTPPRKAVVAFYSNIDAIKTARLMEIHRSLTDKWPETIHEVEDGAVMCTPWQPCRELFIRSWSDAKLQQYCSKNNLDVLYVCTTNQDILSLSISIPDTW